METISPPGSPPQLKEQGRTDQRPRTRGNASLAELLASLPDSDRTKLLNDLTPADTRALLDDWGFWARPNQLAPPGDWTTWLILAGRGFGKTRSGAEWICGRVAGRTPLTAAPGAVRRIALVAETAADARDVIVEGEAGFSPAAPPRPGRAMSRRNGA
jgi:phage terminase large subunit-like protein